MMLWGPLVKCQGLNSLRMFTRQCEENDFRPQIWGLKCNSQFDPQVVESMCFGDGKYGKRWLIGRNMQILICVNSWCFSRTMKIIFAHWVLWQFCVQFAEATENEPPITPAAVQWRGSRKPPHFKSHNFCNENHGRVLWPLDLWRSPWPRAEHTSEVSQLAKSKAREWCGKQCDPEVCGNLGVPCIHARIYECPSSPNPAACWWVNGRGLEWWRREKQGSLRYP